MYKLWTIVRTEFLREFSSPAMWFFFLGLPLLFTAAIGGQLSDSTATEPADAGAVAALAVVCEDDGALAGTFVDLLAEQDLHVITATALPEEGFGIVVPAGFSEALRAGRATTVTLQIDTGDVQSWAVEEAVRAARAQMWTAVQIVHAGAEVAERQGALGSEAERAAFYRNFWVEVDTLLEEPLLRAEVESSGAREVTDAEQASAGQLVTWTQVTLLGASAVLVNERLFGTLQRLAVAPVCGVLVLGGKLLARLFLGLSQMALLILGGALLFDVGWGNSPLAVVAVSVAFAFSMTGLGLLLATIVKTPTQAGSINTGFGMTLAALGGAWWPLEVTPALYQQVALVLPTTWAMRAYTRILVRGAGVQDLLLEIGVLLAFAVFFFVLGVWRYDHSRA